MGTETSNDTAISKVAPVISEFTQRSRTLKLTDKSLKSVEFYAGVLLMYGSTNTGKSTTGLGIVQDAGLQGVKAVHLTLDEIGSSVSTRLTPIAKISKTALAGIFEVVAKEAVLNTNSCGAIVNSYFEIITKYLADENPKIMVIDSIGPVMSVASGLVDQPAGKGGMIEGYGMFLRTLNQIAVVFDCTIVAIINASLFPVSSLEGACDGAIEMTSRGSFSKRDRTNRSRGYSYTITPAGIAEAFKVQQSANLPSTVTEGEVY